MLKAVISHNEQTSIVELPMDRLSLQYELSQIGIRRLAKDIPIMDEEDQPISVKLYSESDIWHNLAVLFRPSHSLEDANVCAHAVVHARPEVQDAIEQSIVYGQYHSPQAVLADIQAMTADLIAVTVNYYCPLQVHMTDEEYGDWYEVDNGYAFDNERAIRELLQKEQNEDLNDMADYFDGSESAKAKIVSAVWDVQEVNRELFGVIRTGLREALSPAEEREWIDELIGQAADGFGEGLEQRPIRTADGEIYLAARLEDEPNAKVRKLIQKDIAALDELQAEMSTARQFLFTARCKNLKPEQVFQKANAVEKRISEQGFEVHRMKKPEIKRFLALYFEASQYGEVLPDIDGAQYFEVTDDETE